MFGLFKRKTAFEGLVQISIANSHALLQDMERPQDAAAMSAYIAAYLHSLGKQHGIIGVDELELGSALMKGACEVFDYSPAFQGLWTQCYADAKAAWSAPFSESPLPNIEDKVRYGAAPGFYDRRRAILPLQIGEDEFLAYSEAVQGAVDRMVSEQAPMWKRGLPANMVRRWSKDGKLSG